MRYKSRSRALVGSAAAGLLALSGLAAVAPPVGAAPPSTDRVEGATRYGTAGDAATQALPTADTVVLTAGENGHLADALAANAIAGANGAPILLTQTDTIPTETQTALDSIDPSNIIIIGGNAAVSADVEAALVAAGHTVTRIEGPHRFATAADAATNLDAVSIDADGADGPQAAMPTVVLAAGVDGGLADAVAASPMLHQDEIPLLLTNTDSLPDETVNAIDDLGATQVLLLGGTAAVSQDVEDQLAQMGVNVERLEGGTRFGTSTAIADFEVDILGFSPATTYLANGFAIPDALAGGPLASVNNGPIVTISETDVPDSTQTWLEERADEITQLVALGGTAVINEGTVDDAATAADPEAGEPEEPTTNQSFTVTGPLQASGFGAANARTCTVTTTENTVVSVALVPSEDVTTSDATVSLADTNQDELYNPPAVQPEIVSINGVAVNADAAHDVTSTGSLNVVLSEDATSDDVMLLVWADPAGAAGNNQVNLTNVTPNNANPKAPTEAFGVGCQTLFVPTEAVVGSHVGETPTLISRPLDLFADADETWYYDSNDQFQYQGVSITMEQFEGILSAGNDADTLTITYAPDASGVSTFNVTTDDVGAPTIGTATVVNADAGETINDVRLTFTPDVDNGPATVFDVFADTDGGNDIDAAERVANDLTVTTVNGVATVTLNNMPNGTYGFFVQAQNPPTGQMAASGESGAVTVPGTADTTAPLAIDNVVTTNNGLGNTFDTGDVFKVVYNEAMGAPATGDLIRAGDDDDGDTNFADPQDTIADFVNGTNATFSLNATAETVNGVSRAANTVLTVTLTAAPTVVQAGTAAGLQIPANVTDQAGINDANGVLWSATAAGQDRLIDQDANDFTASSQDAAAPNMANATIVNATTATVTFDEPVQGWNGNAIVAGQFSYDADNAAGGDVAATGATLSADGTTLTLTFPAATLPASNAADADDVIRYDDDNDGAADAGDVADRGANLPMADQTEALD